MDDEAAIEGRVEEVEKEELAAVVPSSTKSALERRLVRKLDMRIMPMICAMYLFSCKSRSTACLNGTLADMSALRPRQEQPWQCALARAPTGRLAWRPHWCTLRLGQLGVLLLLCRGRLTIARGGFGTHS